MATQSISELALSIAMQEQARGIFESPPHSNRGERIDEYQMGRADLGQAWCLKFVHWCFAQAAARQGVRNPLPTVFAVPPFLAWATKEGKLVPVPQPGDILVKRPAKHVGLVLTAPDNGRFSSV